ncbi:MAG: alanine racemase [Candidatus Zixiibacteriota bacterium]|nr:MAG: alanine racemase [candidate division Zixibacteria bacterium]
MNSHNTNFTKSAISDAANQESAESEQPFFESHSRPSWVEIDLSALRYNVAAVKSKIDPDTKFMAVVKANAYGHGAVRISEAACEEGVDYLGVALLEEADELRNAGIKTPVVILYPENIPRSGEAVKKGYIITVSRIDVLNYLGGILKDRHIPIRYFLKINSGMNRYGIEIENESDLFDSVITGDGYEFMGFTTNLAGSNGGETSLSRKQEDIFCELMESARKRFGNGIYLSYESSGSLSNKNNSFGSLVRIGHLLYGPLNSGENQLKPVMTVKSRIAEIQHVKKGAGVGYGFSYIAKKDMKIAVIPMGYADGYPWSLSNRGFVLIRGEIAGVVGRVCMDAFMVDITDLDGCRTGDEVVVMGSMGKRAITAQALGELAGSFSYEMMSRWAVRLPRIYI